MENFAKLVEQIKKQARTEISEGAVTQSYRGDKEKVIYLLNLALATEIVCVLRYQAHYEAGKGIHSPAIVEEFLEHAKSEQEHADMLANRISQLGGTPNYDPRGLTERAQTQFSVGETLSEMLKEDLIAERIVIGIYQEFIRMVGNNDPTTRRMLEKILEDEEDHADELSSFLFGMGEQDAQKESVLSKKRAVSHLHIQ